MKISERRRMVQVFIGVIVNQSQSFEPKAIKSSYAMVII